MPAILRDYQMTLHDQCVSALADSPRAQVLMACGTGKTITGMKIVETIDPDTVLLLFPNLALLAQTARSWAQHTSWTGWSAIAVCSEKDIKGPDHDPTTAADVTKTTGVPSTTDPELVRAFLAQGGRRVVFSTYQSSEVVAAAVPAGFTFGVALADEAHRTSGQGVSASFGAILDDAVIPADKRIFMTATQRVAADRRGRTKLVRSMDDVALYGEVVAEYGFKEAIEAGTLADYQLAVVLIDRAELDAVSQSAGLPDLDTYAAGERDKRAHLLTTAIATVKMSKRHGLHRLLAYHSSVSRSREFADLLSSVASVLAPESSLYSAHIDGSTKAGAREGILERLSATDTETGWSVVSNMRVLTEGIDVPELDGVIFADPRKSEVDVAQIVGRALRVGSRKEPSVILVPVLVAPGEDAEEQVAGSAFDVPVQIMRSMRRVDARITAEFTAAHMDTREDEPQEWTRDADSGSSMEVGPIKVLAGPEVAAPDSEPTTDSSPRIEVYLPGVDLSEARPEDSDYADCIMALSRAVTTQMIDTVTDSWDKRAAELVEFWEREGREPSMKAIDPKEKGLGSWLVKQRTAVRKSLPSFTSARRAYLDESIPGWLRDPEQDWRDLADLVAAFVTDHGQDPSMKAIGPKERGLGRWLSNQRQAARKSLPYFTSARRAYLDENIPGWLRDPEQGWRNLADQTASFASEHGRYPSTISSDPDEKRIGEWLGKQRTVARKSLPSFTSARRAYLDESIPGWLRDPEQGWRNLADQTASFVIDHGRDPSKKAADPDEKRLGAWLVDQRKAARKSLPSFTSARRAYLDESIPGWLRDPEQDWRDLADLVAAFVTDHGRGPSTEATDPKEKGLGRWLSNQRQAARKSAPSFTPARRAYLDEHIPGWETPRRSR